MIHTFVLSQQSLQTTRCPQGWKISSGISPKQRGHSDVIPQGSDTNNLELLKNPKINDEF